MEVARSPLAQVPYRLETLGSLSVLTGAELPQFAFQFGN